MRHRWLSVLVAAAIGLWTVGGSVLMHAQGFSRTNPYSYWVRPSECAVSVTPATSGVVKVG